MTAFLKLQKLCQWMQYLVICSRYEQNYMLCSTQRLRTCKIISQIATLEIIAMHSCKILSHTWPFISKSQWVTVVNCVLTHKYKGLECCYCLLNNDLCKCNAFLSRHYWFTASLKSIYNSYLSCRLFLDSWENPFKAQAEKRQETREAVS